MAYDVPAFNASLVPFSIIVSNFRTRSLELLFVIASDAALDIHGKVFRDSSSSLFSFPLKKGFICPATQSHAGSTG